MGRVTAVTDASGSRTLTYNADGTLASESIPYIVSGAVEYTYDSLGRRTGLQLKQNSATVFGNSYTYDSMSRLATVSDGTNTATYSRIAGTNLLNTTTITAGGSTKLTTTRNYDAQNRLTSISSVSSVPSVVKTYSYTYDDKDRRSRLDMADGSYWTYTYDAKGQIVSGTKYDSSNKAIPGQSFTYAYDDIGNLTSEQRGMTEMQFDYTSNLVNQYTQRLVPGIIPVTGQACADSTVSVWLKNHGANAAAVTRPTRDGEYFKAAIPVNNSAASVTEALEITAVKFNTTLDKDVVKTINGSYTVPKTPQVFSNDDDGNTTSDGLWYNSWNGENRLIVSINAANTVKQEYAYDFAGRRTYKKTYAWVSGAWSLTQHLKFAYYGFKLLAEYDGTTNALLRKYCWSGDKLEWMMNGSTAYYYVIDGNKNVTSLVDSNGAVVAEYEYDQFGSIISKSGPMADVNPFRFSSEYFDAETGLVYYNFRYYSPDLRRWLSRDPIEENGGVNLYGFCYNNPNSYFDTNGRRPNNSSSDIEDKNFNQYWEEWKNKNPNRDKSQDDTYKETLERGCVGITALNLGYGPEDMPSTKNCYKKREQAEKQRNKMMNPDDTDKSKCACDGNNINGKKAKIRLFSIHLYDKGRDDNGDEIGKSPMVRFDNETGKADLSNWQKNDYPGKYDEKTKKYGINFDYGFVDEDGMWYPDYKSNNAIIIHANHKHDPDGPRGKMHVYFSEADGTPESWDKKFGPGQPHNVEVWCVECDNVKTSK